MLCRGGSSRSWGFGSFHCCQWSCDLVILGFVWVETPLIDLPRDKPPQIDPVLGADLLFQIVIIFIEIFLLLREPRGLQSRIILPDVELVRSARGGFECFGVGCGVA